jgi:hypothetical protein
MDPSGRGLPASTVQVSMITSTGSGQIFHIMRGGGVHPNPDTRWNTHGHYSKGSELRRDRPVSCEMAISLVGVQTDMHSAHLMIALKWQ